VKYPRVYDAGDNSPDTTRESFDNCTERSRKCSVIRIIALYNNNSVRTVSHESIRSLQELISLELEKKTTRTQAGMHSVKTEKGL
jgi:hypothetical protein